MNAKDFFRAVYDARQDAKRVIDERESIMEMATSITSHMRDDKVAPTGETHSKVEDAAVRLADMETNLVDRVERYMVLATEAGRIIEQLPKPRFRQVLSLRYIQGLSWKEVSDRMGYVDPKSVFRVHGFALKMAQKLM